MGKNGVEVIIFNGKNWLDERHIEKQMGLQSILL